MYATQPVGARHLPSWFGGLLIALLVIVLALAAVLVLGMVDLSTLFQAKEYESPVTTEMYQRFFLLEHRADLGL